MFKTSFILAGRLWIVPNNWFIYFLVVLRGSTQQYVYAGFRDSITVWENFCRSFRNHSTSSEPRNHKPFHASAVNCSWLSLYATHSARLNYGTVLSSESLTAPRTCWLIPPVCLWGCAVIIASSDLQSLAEAASQRGESHPSPLPTVWHSFAMQIFRLWSFKYINECKTLQKGLV